jgi:hypothetical protein
MATPMRSSHARPLRNPLTAEGASAAAVARWANALDSLESIAHNPPQLLLPADV